MKYFQSIFKLNRSLRASRIDIRPPVPSIGRTGLSIVAIFKNEEKYIADWIRFHAIAGVRDFIFYDNGSTDATVEVIQSFSMLNIRIIPWVLDTSAHKPKMVLPRQILAYCHAISNFGGNYRWMAFIDIDEYLVPETERTIADCLASLDGFSNISLPWVMFGHSGHEVPPTIPVPLAYTMRATQQSGALLNFKCIVDPCDVRQVSTHKFETNGMGSKSSNATGDIMYNKARMSPAFITSAGLQLNHYYLRSRLEMQQKIAGSAVSGTDHEKRKNSILEKAVLIEKDLVTDKSALKFLARHGISSQSDFEEFCL